MSETRALGLAGAAHVALFAALSLGWASFSKPTPAEPDAIAVDLSVIADVPKAVSREEAAAAAPPPPAASPAEAPLPAPAPAEVAAPPPPATVEAVAKAIQAEATPVTATPTPTRPPSPSPRDLAQTLDRALAPAQPRPRRDLVAELDRALGAAAPRATGAATPQPRNAALDAAAAATLVQAIRAQIVRCWNVPPGSDGMTVDLRIRLARSGAIAAPIEVRAASGGASAEVARAFAESAKRAVQQCAPLSLPAEHYLLWRDIDPLHFDPRDIR